MDPCVCTCSMQNGFSSLHYITHVDSKYLSFNNINGKAAEWKFTQSSHFEDFVR